MTVLFRYYHNPLIRACRLLWSSDTAGGFRRVNNTTRHNTVAESSCGHYYIFLSALPQIATAGSLLSNQIPIIKEEASCPVLGDIITGNFYEADTLKSVNEDSNVIDRVTNHHGEAKYSIFKEGDTDFLRASLDGSAQELRFQNRENSDISRSMFRDHNKSKKSSGQDFKDIESLIDNWTKPVVVKKNRSKIEDKHFSKREKEDYLKSLNPFENETEDEKENSDPLDYTNPFEIEEMEERNEKDVGRGGNPFEEESDTSVDNNSCGDLMCSERSCEETIIDKTNDCATNMAEENDALKVEWQNESSHENNFDEKVQILKNPFENPNELQLANFVSSSSSVLNDCDEDTRNTHSQNVNFRCKQNEDSNNFLLTHGQHKFEDGDIRADIIEEGNNQFNPLLHSNEETGHKKHLELFPGEDSQQSIRSKGIEERMSQNPGEMIQKESTSERLNIDRIPAIEKSNDVGSKLFSSEDTVKSTQCQDIENSGSQNSKQRFRKENAEKASMPVRVVVSGSGEYNNSNTDAASSSNVTSSKQDPEKVDGGDVVLVTGANGFLGQHVVKMLQLKASHVKEIRLLDKTPFVQKLEYEATKPVKILTGTITDTDFVRSSVKGVNSVLHIAGLVSFGTFPDIEGMRAVNVNGTLNIVNACLAETSVSRIVYCSTVDVVVGHEPIQGGDEDNTPVPSDFLFPGYPETKYQGERLVLGASCTPRKHGQKLQTLSLRANVMYGELDPYYVTSGLKMAKQRNGVLTQIGDGRAMFQQAYVGNTAWAFVCADRSLRDDTNLTSRFFYIPDQTPIQNSFNFMRPYLEARGFHLSANPISYSLVYGALWTAEKVAKLVSPVKKLNLPAQTCSIAYINMDLFFKGDKAKEVLKYEPLFSPVEARLMSMEYYKKVDL